MDIRHRLYPYPVLSDMTNDYINSSFSMNLEVTQGMKEICFSISLCLENEEIKQLIADDFAEYVIHIECSYTAYRTVIKTNETEIKKIIPEHKLNGKVAICAFIVAKKEMPKYYNNLFNEDYGNMSFSLNRGNIIGIGGQVNIEITKEVEELSKIPSIFTICRCAEDVDESMKFDITGEKITITLCNESFENYKILSGLPILLPVLHSLLIVPALVYTFEMLRKEGISEFEDLRWFKSIKRTLGKNNMILNEELLDCIPSFELAQKSLDLPINRAFDALVSQDLTDEEE